MIKELLIKGSVGAVSALLVATPAFADVSIEGTNSNTGKKSDNTVENTVKSSTNVEQTNSASITNNITVHSNSGGNKANGNTGNGTVVSGDSSVDVAVSNTANTNESSLSCGCENGSVSVTGSNDTTGKKSHNTVKNKAKKKTKVQQTNAASVTNNLDLSNKTGKNKANDNTGDGSVTSGGSDPLVDVTTDVNHNTSN